MVDPSSSERDNTSSSGKSTTHHRTCNLCEAMCGITIQTRGNQILSIKGDSMDPLSQGHICPKAVALQDLHEDPDRQKYPLRKTAEGWQRISWNEAFDLAANKLRQVQREHGRNAVGVYIGNPSVHNHGMMLTSLPFLKALGTKKRFSATSNDQLPHMLANLRLFGHQLLFPIPDIDHTHLFICLGTNPMASNGSLMSAPGFQKRIKQLKARGGRFVVIDPRRTETAELADEHLAIRPGTDALLLLAMLKVIFDESLVSPGRLEPYCDGIDTLRQACQPFTPESVQGTTGIPAEAIRTLARQLATTPRAVLFGRMGTSTQAFGGLATWLIYVLNILTGNLDQRGGLMFSRPAADLVALAALGGQKGHIGRYRSRINNLPEFGGELPSSTLADEMLTPGHGQIKAMVTMAGNPVLSSPNGQKLEKALQGLDFMVAIDFYINETTQHADLILPPTGPLEHSHFDLIFNLFAVRNVAKYSEALFTPAPDTRHDWQILSELTRRLSRKSLASRLTDEARHQAISRLGVDRLLDVILRTGPYGSQLPGTSWAGSLVTEVVQDLLPRTNPLRQLLDMSPYSMSNAALLKGVDIDTLKQHPHGVDLGPLQPSIPERLYTPGQRINCADDLYLNDLARLQDHQAMLTTYPDQLLLIGRRQVRSNNSWLHNSERLVKGNPRCTLIMHPKDAAQRKLVEGAQARVTSAVGEINVTLSVSDQIMPGVVSLPHGWGHHRPGNQLRVASAHAGVSVNDLTDDSYSDQVSGTSALNGVPVQVSSLEVTKEPTARAKKSRLKKRGRAHSS
ncbi:MAG: molybdopterin-dependent oxidoreductase [Hahellaceae bacterium]|nr:molybdopterin-dependent oxidoreductase [Hahellaceae bacterium]